MIVLSHRKLYYIGFITYCSPTHYCTCLCSNRAGYYLLCHWLQDLIPSLRCTILIVWSYHWNAIMTVRPLLTVQMFVLHSYNELSVIVHHLFPHILVSVCMHTALITRGTFPCIPLLLLLAATALHVAECTYFNLKCTVSCPHQSPSVYAKVFLLWAMCLLLFPLDGGWIIVNLTEFTTGVEVCWVVPVPGFLLS